MSSVITKADVDKPFKLSGLFLAPDASNYVMQIIQRVDASKRQKVLRRLVDTILKQKIDSNRISKALCEAAVNECKAERTTDTPVLFVIDAFSVVYQRVLRHQVFSQTAMLDGNQATSYRIRPIEFLLASGSKIDSVVVLGMISQLREGDWHVEDPTGVVRLNLKHAVFHEGLFPEGSIVLIEGFYEDAILHVTGMGLPPCESSEVSRRAFSVSNPFGGGPPGSLAAPQDAKMFKLLTTTQAGADAMVVIVGETRLDKPGCLERLAMMFNGYTSCPPVAFILTGNFLSSDSTGRSFNERRQILKRLLRQLISTFQTNFPELNNTPVNQLSTTQYPQLILVPGPEDPVLAPIRILPRPSLPLDMALDVNNAATSSCPPWLHLTTNPCRIRLYTREIVVFRVDYTRLLVRHCIHLPSLVSETMQNNTTETQDVGSTTATDLLESQPNINMDSEHLDTQQDSDQTPKHKPASPTEVLGQGLARCLASQAHLLPVLGHIAPVYWDWDQALSLHPLPNLVVAVEPNALADLNASEPSLVGTGNCRFINPGRFGQTTMAGSSQLQINYAFKVYYPKTGVIEDSCLPD